MIVQVINAYVTQAGGAFDPTDLFDGGYDGFIFDPSDLSTVFEDTGATNPSEVDAVVRRMNDKSGNGNNATRSSGGAPRLRLSSGVYSLDYLTGSNAEALLLPADLQDGWTAGTIIFAAKWDGANASSAGVIGNFGSSFDDRYPYIFSNPDRIDGGFLSTSLHNCGAAPTALTSWHVADFHSAASLFEYFFNAQRRFNTTSNTVSNGNVSPPLFGGGWGGHIGRVICINRVLSGDDLTNAREWCAATYGAFDDQSDELNIDNWSTSGGWSHTSTGILSASGASDRAVHPDIFSIGQSYHIILPYNKTAGSKLRVRTENNVNLYLSAALANGSGTLEFDITADGNDIRIEADTAVFSGTIGPGISVTEN